MAENLFISLGEKEILFLSHNEYLLGVVKSLGKSFLLETEKEEIILGTGNEDIICVSSLVDNEKLKPVMISTLYSLRELSFPLIILNKGHPASKRLKLVFGFGDKIILDSCIEAGTHPDQHLLCSSENLSGLILVAKKGGVEIVDPFNRKIIIERKIFELKL
ncbi:MAG TPA: hypothetical protein PLO36_03765 [Methanofastidiosum sp.]|nr:hypothetical protein [Methanofastidiosum sp.]HPA49234.1 hypothetical protein [Methanofastidiosum sp.]HQK62990.1 hypothetical protein [Methanofastidiosum sp.]HQM95174.1 hypothetical protein [Methanofastidiosum sp.]HQQ48538.1 hypothetical protein [Methanofastidiosum sp.]